MHSRLTLEIPQTTVTLHYRSLKVKVQTGGDMFNKRLLSWSCDEE